jgi:hypothetical protein
VPSTGTAEEKVELKWADVNHMEKSGRVSFGASTMHHPVLACMQHWLVKAAETFDLWRLFLSGHYKLKE